MLNNANYLKHASDEVSIAMETAERQQEKLERNQPEVDDEAKRRLRKLSVAIVEIQAEKRGGG